jgi:uncharacterized protein (UPF0297 family)
MSDNELKEAAGIIRELKENVEQICYQPLDQIVGEVLSGQVDRFLTKHGGK